MVMAYILVLHTILLPFNWIVCVKNVKDSVISNEQL